MKGSHHLFRKRLAYISVAALLALGVMPFAATTSFAEEPESDAEPVFSPVTASISDQSSEDDSSAMHSNAEYNWDVTLSAKRNTTEISISNPGFAQLLSDGQADSIKVTGSISYKGKVTRQVSESFDLSGIDDDSSFIFDAKNFGRVSVTVEYCLDGNPVKELDAQDVAVTADTYNISPVSATLPVTFFSLNLWGENSIRKTGPVIAVLERANSYDWNNLPQPEGDQYGMYGLPYLTEDEVSYQPGDFDAASSLFRKRADVIADYVHDLMELDSTSHINLYCVDYYAGLVQRVIYANKIPEDQYKIVLMSDGSYSYNEFAAVYKEADNSAKNASYIAKWNAAKADAYRNGAVDSDFLNWDYANDFLWALVDTEPNAQWWVARKDLIKSSGDDNAFGKTVQGDSKVVQVNISNLLKTNIQPSESNTAEFKALYNFNDGYFKAAEENGKDVMMFLGTRLTNEQSFSEYARFAMLYYGDGYEYYYKGHPGTPTSLYPNKVKQLEDLSITDVDSSVAAELILFFNPDIYLSGYNSSTYASVPSGMAKGMFEMTKAYGLSQPQFSDMDYWSSRITDSSDQTIKALTINGHSNFLVEFSDSISAAKGYDIAIWDATDSVAKFYKQQEGKYVLVDQTNGESEKPAIEAGEYVITSALSQSSVLDVSGGSSSNGANVQLYGYNGSNAQKWSVSFDDQGYATIKNLGSGKVLDASYGSSSNGTNVWQYQGSDGNKAQKWRIVSNDDGTVSIVSALSPTSVVDVNGASTADGANVQLWSSNGSAAQKFSFVSISPEVTADGQAELEDGWYTFSTALDMSSKIDIRDWSKANGANAQIWSDTGWQNQTYKVTKVDNGFYSIVSAWSNKALDVDGGRVVPGAKIQQWDYSSSNRNQQWAIYANEGGSYTLRNVASGLYLTVDGNSARSGSGLVGSLANGRENQRWLIAQASDPQKSMEEWAKDSQSVLPDGTYVIQSSLSDGLVLDVQNGSKANWANVQLWNVNLSSAQKWVVSHDSDGFVTFTNLGSGKVLDVAGASSVSGANVQQYEANGSKAQKWVVLNGKDGKKVIASALSSSLALDVQSANANAGANLQLYSRNGSIAQNFNFYRLV